MAEEQPRRFKFTVELEGEYTPTQAQALLSESLLELDGTIVSANIREYDCTYWYNTATVATARGTVRISVSLLD